MIERAGGPVMLSIGSLWNERMAIGIEPLDDHHKTILRLMLEVQAEIGGAKHAEDIRAVLAALVSYSKYHFLAEERIMLEKGFPELELQRGEHRWYVQRIEEISSAYNVGDGAVFNHDLLEHLKAWFADHILTKDIRLREFVHDKNPG
jgi:hemerythrin